MKLFKQYLKDNPKAQTAMELAVFGSIIIFVLGAIIKQVIAITYQQNQQLKSMRMAMATSYQASELGQSGRNTANIIIIEDRLGVGMDKYGAVDRVPYIHFGNATHTRNLFMSTDWNEEGAIPRFDVYINGQFFSFTMGRFKDVPIPYKASYYASNTGNHEGDPTVPPEGINPIFWHYPCVQLDLGRVTVNNVLPGWLINYFYEDAGSWLLYDTTDTTYSYGCAKFYKLVYNVPSANALSGYSYAPPNADIDRRFNLDLDFSTYCSEGPAQRCSSANGADVPQSLRAVFSWQWVPVYMVFTDKKAKYVNYQGFENKEGVSFNDGKNLSVDIDGDLKEEQIVAIEKDLQSYSEATSIIKRVQVLDFQDGDIDFSEGKKNEGPRPGFNFDDLQMWTFVKGNDPATPNTGTFLRIESGSLYSGSNQYVRKIRRRDQVDVIQRTFQLSNNTGRFCSTVTQSRPGRMDTVDGKNNSVEVCCNHLGCCDSSSPVNDSEAGTCGSSVGGTCFSDNLISRTCMDTNSKIIFIRSRVQDRRGQKWITRTQEDHYIPIDIK